jgi:uncharacterized protein DUF3105
VPPVARSACRPTYPPVALILAAIALAGCGGNEDSDEGGNRAVDVLPSGGQAPPRSEQNLAVAVQAAGCTLERQRGESRDHTRDLEEPVAYPTNPPASGRHYELPAEDGAYEEAPADSSVVHSLEHGRVTIWFSPELPRARRAELRALFDEDSSQLLMVPRPRMPYELAASAWNRDPEPLGTGRLITCERLGDATFDAARAFRDEHRGQGPEALP